MLKKGFVSCFVFNFCGRNEFHIVSFLSSHYQVIVEFPPNYCRENRTSISVLCWFTTFLRELVFFSLQFLIVSSMWKTRTFKWSFGVLSLEWMNANYRCNFVPISFPLSYKIKNCFTIVANSNDMNLKSYPTNLSIATAARKKGELINAQHLHRNRVSRKRFIIAT